MINFIRTVSRLTMVVLCLTTILVQAQTTYQLNTKQSKLFWKGTKTIGTKHFGFLRFNAGWIRANAAGKLIDGVFTLNMNSITSTEHENKTSNKKIEYELKGSSFFEVSKYPVTTITINSMMPTAKPSQFKVNGNLTIKKSTHPITFLATIKKSASGLTAHASLTIDRVRWGIHETSEVSFTDKLFSNIKDKMIADEIPISLNLVFTNIK